MRLNCQRLTGQHALQASTTSMGLPGHVGKMHWPAGLSPCSAKQLQSRCSFSTAAAADQSNSTTTVCSTAPRDKKGNEATGKMDQHVLEGAKQCCCAPRHNTQHKAVAVLCRWLHSCQRVKCIQTCITRTKHGEAVGLHFSSCFNVLPRPAECNLHYDEICFTCTTTPAITPATHPMKWDMKSEQLTEKHRLPDHPGLCHALSCVPACIHAITTQ